MKARAIIEHTASIEAAHENQLPLTKDMFMLGDCSFSCRDVTYQVASKHETLEIDTIILVLNTGDCLHLEFNQRTWNIIDTFLNS